MSRAAQAQIDAIVSFPVSVGLRQGQGMELTNQGKVLLYGYAGHCKVLALCSERTNLHTLHSESQLTVV